MDPYYLFTGKGIQSVQDPHKILELSAKIILVSYAKLPQVAYRDFLTLPIVGRAFAVIKDLCYHSAGWNKAGAGLYIKGVNRLIVAPFDLLGSAVLIPVYFIVVNHVRIIFLSLYSGNTHVHPVAAYS